MEVAGKKDASGLNAQKDEFPGIFVGLDHLMAEPVEGKGELFLLEDPNGFAGHDATKIGKPKERRFSDEG